MIKNPVGGVPICGRDLSPEILAAAQNLARAYWYWTERPQLSSAVLKHWDALIDAWAERGDLPLFIRKQGANIGERIVHVGTLRHLAPCDNSPAHWVMIAAFSRGKSMTLDDISTEITKHKIPVTMAMSKADIADSAMQGVLARMKEINASSYGWKVDHIEEVGLKTQMKIHTVDIGVLKDHFKRLMKPSNIVLVPSKLKGLGDMPAFLDLVRKSATSGT